MLANILAAVGIFFTLLFGYLTIRRKKYPIRMRFYVLDLVQLTDPQVRKYKNLSISYSNKEIKEGLLYFKGLFVNEGDADVKLKCEDEKQKMRICLPSGCRWLELHQAESHEGITAHFMINSVAENEVVVETDLIKRSEIFAIEGLVAGSKIHFESGVNSVSIRHRMEGADNIKAERLNIESEKEQKSLGISLGLIGLFLIFLLGIAANTIRQEIPINYVKSADENHVLYSATGRSLDSIEATSRESVFALDKQRYSVSEFDDEFEICLQDSKSDRVGRFLLLSLYILVSLVIIVGVAYIYLSGIYRRRIIASYEKLQVPQQNKKME